MDNQQDIVIAGYAGELGAVRIATLYEAELRARFREAVVLGMLKKTSVDESSVKSLIEDEDILIDVRDGGVLTTLYDVATEHNLGISIALRKIPMTQATVEICEMYELNPYRLLSEAYVILTEHGMRIVDKLHEAAIPAACIGHTINNQDKIITDKEEIEYINRPTDDEILKIIKP